MHVADIRLKLDERVYALLDDYAQTATDRQHADALDRIYRRFERYSAKLVSRTRVRARYTSASVLLDWSGSL